MIKTLENTSLATITAAFNEAFSDYIIPIQWKEGLAAQKFKWDNIDLSLSPGFFVDGKLCGFIFHGIGKKEGLPVVWNGGTGVVPDQRGQGITNQLYEFILPALRNKGFDRTVLEVIKGNDPAIHIYKKNGFEQVRQLECYKGSVVSDGMAEGIVLKDVSLIDWPLFHSFRSWEPTFQNNDQKIILLEEKAKIIGAYDKESLVAYIIFMDDPEGGAVFQFAVKETYRSQGIGKALFAKATESKNVPLKVINVDERDKGANLFLEKIGLEKILSQFEMLKTL